jgi:hypothetical protein
MEILQVVTDTAAETNTFIEKLSIKFFVRLIIDVASMIILLRLVYYPIYKKKEFFFTFCLFNMVIFLITYLLNKNEGLSTGAAFGLFAVFSLLRYRTENISTRDMTYLFSFIAIGLLSAVGKGTYFETAIVNAVVIVTAFILDSNLIFKNECVKNIQYEKIENIKPENREALMTDLRNRTGLNIHRVMVSKVDFTKDTAVVKIYFYDDTASCAH